MSRAVETADLISAHLPDVKLLPTDGILREGAPITPEPRQSSWKPEVNCWTDGPRIEAAFRKVRSSVILIIFPHILIILTVFPQSGAGSGSRQLRDCGVPCKCYQILRLSGPPAPTRGLAADITEARLADHPHHRPQREGQPPLSGRGRAPQAGDVDHTLSHLRTSIGADSSQHVGKKLTYYILANTSRMLGDIFIMFFSFMLPLSLYF